MHERAAALVVEPAPSLPDDSEDLADTEEADEMDVDEEADAFEETQADRDFIVQG
jgi:hypothetical protein